MHYCVSVVDDLSLIVYRTKLYSGLNLLQAGLERILVDS